VSITDRYVRDSALGQLQLADEGDLSAHR